MINSFRNVSYNYFLNICYSVAKSCLTLCDPMDCSLLASLAFTISQSSLKLMSTQSVMPSDHLILCHPFLLLPSIFPSIRVFSSKSAFQKSGGQSIGASASASVLPVNIQGWFPLGFDLLVVQGTLKSLLQHISKASILQHSTFFMVKLSHPNSFGLQLLVF